MSERLRILAAAAELRSFSAAALSARANANLHTVRAVLQRDHELFEVIGQQRGAGRPARRFRVADEQRLTAELGRAQLSSLDESDFPASAGLSSGAESDSGPSQATGGLPPLPEPLTGTPLRQRPSEALLEAASTALTRAVGAQDVRERATYAGSAARTTSALLRGEDELAFEPSFMAPDGQHRRAALLGLAAEMVLLTCGEATGSSLRDGLARVASALVPVVEHAPDQIPRFLRGVLTVSRQLGFAPPVAVVTTSMQPDPFLLRGRPAGDWVAHPLTELHSTLWSPSWAEELLQSRSLAGMVVDGQHVSDFADYLGKLEGWRMPKIVSCTALEAEADDDIGRAGAIKIDGLRSLEDALDPLGKALEQRGTPLIDDSLLMGLQDVGSNAGFSAGCVASGLWGGFAVAGVKSGSKQPA